MIEPHHTSKPYKTAPPSLQRIVLRERLFASLDRNEEGGCTWIWGPPGSGKTSLVAGWVESRRLNPLWYQCDIEDSDPSAFFFHVATALSKKGNLSLPLLTPEQLFDVAGFARRFFEGLIPLLDAPAVIILDNFQDVPDSNPLDRLIAQAVHRFRGALHVVIISRTKPSAAPRVSASGSEARILGADALRLVRDETAAIASQLRIDSAEVVERAHLDGGGWAAAVRLILEAKKLAGERSDLEEIDFPQVSFDRHFWRIFEALPQTKQHTLQQLAVLPHITRAMAEAVTGADGVQVLTEMHRQGLYSMRRTAGSKGRGASNATAIFHLHPLFQDILRARALTSIPSDKVARLLTQAGDAAAAEAFDTDALTLYQQAAAWDRYADLLDRRAPALISQGMWQSLVGWIGLLPPKVLNRRSLTLYWRGVALMALQPQQARESFFMAKTLCDKTGDVAGSAASLGSIAWTYHFEGFSSRDLGPLIPQLAPFALMDNELPLASRFTAASGFLIATMWQQPDHPLLPACIQPLMAALKEPLDANQRLAVASFLAIYLTMTGELNLGKELIALGEGLASDPAVTPLTRGFWKFYRANLNFALGPKELAESLNDAATYSDAHGLLPSQLLGNMMRAVSAVTHYQGDTAAALLQRAESLMPPGRFIEEGFFFFASGLVAQLRGEPAVAAHFARRAISNAAHVRVDVLRMVWGYLCVPCIAASGHADEARDVLEQSRSIRRKSPFAAYDAVDALCEAFLFRQDNDVPKCRAALHVAMNIIHERPYLLDYARAIPTVVADIIGTALELDVERGFVQDVARRWNLRPPKHAPRQWPYAVKLRALGPFEVLIDDEPVKFQKRAPGRLLELLKYLCAMGGKNISQRVLCDILWPDAEGDQASFAFTNALHRVRKLLGRDDALILRDGKLSLNGEVCWLDVCDVGHLMENRMRLASLESMDDAALDDLLANLFDLYRGELIAGDDHSHLLAPRTKLRRAFETCLASTFTVLDQRGRHAAAVAAYAKAIEREDTSEPLYRGLMNCYLRMHELGLAKRTYDECVAMLRSKLNIAPSRETLRLAAQLEKLSDR